MNRLADPEKEMSWKEVYGHILTALKTLRKKDREAFVLCKIDELTQQETAELLKVSRSTVRRRLYRARVNLQKKLDHLRDG